MLNKTEPLLPITAVKVTAAGLAGRLHLQRHDLELMAAHWRKSGRDRLPVTFEHTMDRVIGFAINLRRSDRYLVADLLLSRKAYRAVETGELVNVSIGWAWSGYERGLVVTSIGLAGRDRLPACRNLPPIQVALDDMRAAGMRSATYA